MVAWDWGYTFANKKLAKGMLASLILLCVVNTCDSVITPRKSIIVDAEMGSRIREASVVFDDTIKVQSFWDGSVEIPDSFAVMKISHEGYLQRVMYASELTDTIRLLNNGRNLDEVVIWGNYMRPHISFKYNEGKLLPNPGSGGASVSFDFFKSIDNLAHYKRNKRRKRIQKVVSEY